MTSNNTSSTPEVPSAPSKSPKPSSTITPTQPSPYIPLFTHFRSELDTHHDRRERTIKASRDITAASKKIIFTLQRTPAAQAVRQTALLKAQETNKPYYETIRERFRAVSQDLGATGLDRARYARQISGGLQEWMEAVGFETYLTEGRVLGWEEARGRVRGLCGGTAAGGREGREGDVGPEAGAMDADGATPEVVGAGVDLGYEDYILGIYDLTGEIMRWAITGMATTGTLPVAGPASEGEGDRNVLTDLRALRAALESLEVSGHGPFARDVEGKARVMRQSVEKVEKALYGLVVRGAERPTGWMPDLRAGEEVGVEG